jgi:hypothetical protein
MIATNLLAVDWGSTIRPDISGSIERFVGVDDVATAIP